MAEAEATTSSFSAPDVKKGTGLHRTPSPRLSQETQEEIIVENDAAHDDSSNHTLHSAWSFWFERWVARLM